MNLKYELTTCPYCGCGCGLLLEVLDGRLTGTYPCKTSPVNQGQLCIKGWNAHEFVHSPNRLASPLVRKDGALETATWDEALDLCVEKLKAISEVHGPDSIFFCSSARCTNEENYLLQKFARAGNRNQQYRSLRPSLTLSNRGRSCRGIWQWRNDEFYFGNRWSGLHFYHRFKHHRCSPLDSTANLQGSRKWSQAPGGRPSTYSTG